MRELQAALERIDKWGWMLTVVRMENNWNIMAVIYMLVDFIYHSLASQTQEQKSGVITVLKLKIYRIDVAKGPLFFFFVVLTRLAKTSWYPRPIKREAKSFRGNIIREGRVGGAKYLIISDNL